MVNWYEKRERGSRVPGGGGNYQGKEGSQSIERSSKDRIGRHRWRGGGVKGKTFAHHNERTDTPGRVGGVKIAGGQTQIYLEPNADDDDKNPAKPLKAARGNPTEDCWHITTGSGGHSKSSGEQNGKHHARGKGNIRLYKSVTGERTLPDSTAISKQLRKLRQPVIDYPKINAGGLAGNYRRKDSGVRTPQTTPEIEALQSLHGRLVKEFMKRRLPGLAELLIIENENGIKNHFGLGGTPVYHGLYGWRKIKPAACTRPAQKL